jgi:phosphatase NudJ
MSPPRWSPSATVAAIVAHAGRYLLVEEHTPEGLRLNNPAGHLEPNESLLQGVVRETLEETARHLQVQALVGVYLARLQPPDERVRVGKGLPRRSGATARAGQTELAAARQAAGRGVSYLRFAFCGSVGEVESGRCLDHGIVRTLWMTAQQVHDSSARHRSPLVWRCIADHLAGRRYPLALLNTDPSVYASTDRAAP